MTKKIDEILHDLKNKMKPERFHHTLGVMYTAANLAYAHNCDPNKAILAGALHDCAKLESLGDYISKCNEIGIPVPEYAKKSPHLLHAQLGEYFAQTIYGVQDQEVLHAISVHTTGCPDMSLLDKIIYVADYIEPGRFPYEGIAKLRATAYKDLDMAIVLESKNVLEYIAERGFTTDPRTEETYNHYLELINRRE